MKRILIKITFILLTFFIFKTIFYKVNTNPIIQILDESNEEIVYLINGNKTNSVDLNKLDKRQIDYILEIEDKEFYNHNGYSPSRILKSASSIFSNKRITGASTITQQVVKNIYLDNKRLLSRKLKEIALARKLEKNLSKDEILEQYLSCIYFGNGIYGITNAARYYYNKDYWELTDSELISFIALWNAPSIYSNDINKWNNKKNQYIEYLYKNNKLSLDELKKLQSRICLNIKKEYINSNRQFYIDAVTNELSTFTLKTKFTQAIIVSTNYTKALENIKANTEYAIMAYGKDGYIKCCIGNNDYYSSTYNIVDFGKRDIGSTIKPLLYYELIKCNYENKTFVSEPFSYKYKDKIYSVSNSNIMYYGSISLKEAIAVSDNIYAIKAHLFLGTNTLKYHLKAYGIDTVANPSLALGSVSLSLHKLVDIYSQFFSSSYIHSRYIKEIKADKIYQLDIIKKQIYDKKICLKVKELLRAPFSKEIPNATCSKYTDKLVTPCYGKSGLTDYDSYMIGFSESYIVGVWVGYSNGDLLIDAETKKLPKKLFCQAINSLELISPRRTD